MKAFILIFLLSITSISWSLNISDVKIHPPSKNEEYYSLYVKKTKLAELKTIGGAPKVVEVQPIAKQFNQTLYLLVYEAGISGTRAQYLLDKAVLLLEQNGKYTLLAELNYRMTVYEGSSIIHSEKRPISWNPTTHTLHVGAFEDEPIKAFVWNKSGFKEEKTK